MFLSKIGVYEPCGIFTFQHWILIVVAVMIIAIALKLTINKKEVQTIIRKCTIFVCIFEVIIITFKIVNYGFGNINNYVPLYYCSLLLYAGIFSSFCKGKLKRVGDVFLATGAIIGGIVYLFFPTTSLLSYPAVHLISFHSFLYHGIMIFLGLLINCTNYIELKKEDIAYYSGFVGVICVIAYIVNKIFRSNLMFISQNFPGTPIEVLYNFFGRFFTTFAILAQMTLPFYMVYGIKKGVKELIKNN